MIEDLSNCWRARAAAWSEVARRMAHEIKNPLTPIQLSAERIAKSFGRATANGGGNGANLKSGRSSRRKARRGCDHRMHGDDQREVAGLKAMVDEFSRFARLPATRLDSQINDLSVRHRLYQNGLTESR